MKIDQRFQKTASIKPNSRLNPELTESNKNFSDFMQHKNKEYSQELMKKLLDEIDNQGKSLINTKNLKELKTYKNLIKKFMDEALKAALLLDDQYSYDRRSGRTKRYKIIREIDKKLLELTDITLEKEEGNISLLDQIGEIRGLLVNLYY